MLSVYLNYLKEREEEEDSYIIGVNEEIDLWVKNIIMEQNKILMESPETLLDRSKNLFLDSIRSYNPYLNYYRDNFNNIYNIDKLPTENVYILLFICNRLRNCHV